MNDVNAVYFDENVWLTQKMIGLLYNVETNTINYHLKKIFADGEVDENAVIRKFRITAADGKRYSTNHYNLSAKADEHSLDDKRNPVSENDIPDIVNDSIIKIKKLTEKEQSFL